MDTKVISKIIKAVLIILIGVSCSEDQDITLVAPSSTDAAFSYIVDAESPNIIHFSASPALDTWYTHWSFGDGSSAEGLEATKTYFVMGTYEVRFKIFTEGGTAYSEEKIMIESDLADESNLVTNGDFVDDQNWTVLPISDGVDVNFVDGQAIWTGGGWGQVGIYQEIEVEAGLTYQINMDIAGSGATDSWFEVYAGASVPIPGTDYTDGGMLMGLNTWNGCGNSEFSDKLANITCNGGDGSFVAANDGILYLVIRGGGADYGTTGISVDNVEVRAE